MMARSVRVQVHLVLASAMAIALGLRLWGVEFGLPYAYHVDEQAYVSAALNLGAGIIGKQPNPTGFSNILFGEYATYFLIGRLAGVFPSAVAFEQAYRADPSMFLLLGRLTSALFGTATVFVVYWMGRTICDRATGLVAACMYAVAFLSVRDAHFSVPDTAGTFWVSLAVLGCMLCLKAGRWQFVMLGAMAAGMAVATKWSLIWVVVPLLLTVLWVVRDSTRTEQSSRMAWGVATWAVIGLLGGLLLGAFQLFVEPATYLEYASREARSGDAGGFGFWQIDTVPGWLFYAQTLGYGVGIAILILGLAGMTNRMVMAVRRLDRISLVLLSFPVIYYLSMGATRHYFARYALPLVPFVTLFAAEAVFLLAGRLQARRRMRYIHPLAAVLTMLAIAEPLVSSVRFDMLLTQTDTRTLAKEWIEQNLPAGAKIAVDWRWHGPPLATSKSPSPESHALYDVTLSDGIGLAEHSIDWYREQGYDYLVASSFVYQIPLVSADEDQERKAFYAALPSMFNEVGAFSPAQVPSEPDFIFDELYGPFISLWQRERPGPVLRIYRVTHE